MIGESGDAPEMTTVSDYSLHYLEMFDQLGLERPNLVGLSMGGRLAATFAIEHRRRVKKLVLVAPADGGRRIGWLDTLPAALVLTSPAAPVPPPLEKMRATFVWLPV